MPSHRAHCFIDRLYLGKAYLKIHRKMDWPYKIVGRHHRRYFHDLTSALIIAEEQYPGDQNAVASALLHIHYDELCSANPLFKQQLETAAWIDSKERQKQRRRQEQRTPTLRPSKAERRFISDLKKLEKARRLWQLLHSTNPISAQDLRTIKARIRSSARRRRIPRKRKEEYVRVRIRL